MATPKISKKAYCKKAEQFPAQGKQFLQTRLSTALTKLKKIGNRKEVQGENQNNVRTIIYHRSAYGMLFGILASYERGTHQLTVAEDDEAETLSVEQVAPPQNDKDKRREFLEGTCYFGVLRNHVVIVASQSLNQKAAEGHFNWIMKQADTLPESDYYSLSDQITKATRARIRAAHVKEVKFGTPLIEAQQDTQNSVTLGSNIKSFIYSGLGLNILQEVVGEDFMQRLHLADAVDGNIEVSLSVRYKRTTSLKAQKILDKIALEMRNLNEDDVQLKLEGGAIVKGSELKLSRTFRVEGQDGIPNPDSIFSHMHEWLTESIELNIIEP